MARGAVHERRACNRRCPGRPSLESCEKGRRPGRVTRPAVHQPLADECSVGHTDGFVRYQPRRRSANSPLVACTVAGVGRHLWHSQQRSVTVPAGPNTCRSTDWTSSLPLSWYSQSAHAPARYLTSASGAMAFLSVLAALFRQPFRWSPHSWPIFRPVDSTFQTDFFTRDFGWQDGSTAACAAQERELLNGDVDVEAAGLLD